MILPLGWKSRASSAILYPACWCAAVWMARWRAHIGPRFARREHTRVRDAKQLGARPARSAPQHADTRYRYFESTHTFSSCLLTLQQTHKTTQAPAVVHVCAHLIGRSAPSSTHLFCHRPCCCTWSMAPRHREAVVHVDQTQLASTSCCRASLLSPLYSATFDPPLSTTKCGTLLTWYSSQMSTPSSTSTATNWTPLPA